MTDNTSASPRPARRVIAALLDQPWAITEPMLRTMVQVAAREADIEAVQARLGRPLANTYSVTMRDGVAVIPLDGPIFRRANLFTQVSGGVSSELLARDFTAALNDASVRGIIIDCNSPGGQVDGTNELSAMIAAARGRKPIVAYVSGQACSAAYWIASACDQIVVDATALVGSIGVIASVPRADADEDADIQFVSSQSPRKAPDPASDDGKADIQAMVDALAQVFIEAVARNRGVTPDTVARDFGAGGVFVGQAAVDAGLADHLGSFESVLSNMIRPSTGGYIGAAGLHRASDVNGLSPVTLSAPLPSDAAPGSAVVDTDIATVGASLMSDNTPVVVEATDTPVAPQVADAALQAQLTAYLSQMEAGFQSRLAAALAQAQAESERRIAAFEERRAIEGYAQHITTASLARPHALPGHADSYTAFLSSLNAAQRQQAQALFDAILASGLVPFEEIGATGAETQTDPKQEFNALVAAKVAAGMGQAAAYTAVARERPELAARLNGKGR